MGGFFNQQQAPTTVIGPAAMYGPFAGQFVQALSRLFNQPAPGVTPLEEGTIRGAFQGARPIAQTLQSTATGGFLPGTGTSGNPFTEGLMALLRPQEDVARRQLMSSAQRAGAVNSSDFLRNSANLETQLYGQRAGVLSPLWEAERGRMMAAPGLLGQLGQGLLGMAGLPRQAALQEQFRPFQMGLGLLEHMRFPHAIGGQTESSPFASILQGILPFIGGPNPIYNLGTGQFGNP